MKLFKKKDVIGKDTYEVTVKTKGIRYHIKVFFDTGAKVNTTYDQELSVSCYKPSDIHNPSDKYKVEIIVWDEYFWYMSQIIESGILRDKKNDIIYKGAIVAEVTSEEEIEISALKICNQEELDNLVRYIKNNPEFNYTYTTEEK